MLKNKKLIYYALGPILGGIFQLISIQFMSWFFDSLYVGMFSLIMVASYFSLIILTLGLDQSFAREFHANKNKTALLVHSIMPGILFLSLIGPDEWNQIYIGSFRLDSDDKWDKIN